MVVALVVLEGLKSTLVSEILSVLEGLVALEHGLQTFQPEGHMNYQTAVRGPTTHSSSEK